MKKLIAELFDYELETVEDVITALLKMPKGFTLHPLGQKCWMGIDYLEECVYMDDPAAILEYTVEVVNDYAERGKETVVEINDEKLTPYRIELYAVIGYSDVCGNGSYQAQLMGVFSTGEMAEECGNELVESGVIHHYEIEHPKLDEFGRK